MKNRELIVEDWAALDYQKALEQQLLKHQEVVEDPQKCFLLFCEHPAVITKGRACERHPIQWSSSWKNQIPVIDVSRGGLATFHGPGQIVLYVIAKLGDKTGPFQGVVSLIRFLEKITIEVIKETCGLDTFAIEGETGVWTRKTRKKIANIGIASKNWVSYHGLSINVGMDQEIWNYFNPCGYKADQISDVKKELISNTPDIKKIKSNLIQKITEQLQAYQRHNYQ